MTPTDALELPVRSARDVAEHYIARCAEWPVADFRLDEDQCEMVCRALLSLSSRLERYKAVIDSVRNWRDVMRGPISPNRIEMLWRDEQVCQALLKSIDSLDADPVTGSGGEGE
jgi:hypothetical protein